MKRLDSGILPWREGESGCVGSQAQPNFAAMTRHCRGCGYDLKGLALRGRCPECGMEYDRPEQAEAAAGASRHCRACCYDLMGLPSRGRCPECGTGYDRMEQALEARRAEARHVSPEAEMRDWWERWRPSAWTLAVVLLTVGGAAVMLTFGYVALHKIAYIMDPPCGCGGGGGGFPL